MQDHIAAITSTQIIRNSLPFPIQILWRRGGSRDGDGATHLASTARTSTVRQRTASRVSLLNDDIFILSRWASLQNTLLERRMVSVNVNVDTCS